MSLFTTQGYRYQLVAGDNVILDTFQDESIKISNNITELFDIGSVPGTFTRTITLPGTKKNNSFFEQYYDISVYSPDNFNSNQKVAAYLDFGAVYLVNGYLQLSKVNVYENKFVDSYEINIFGAISNFSVETNRLFLSDLDNLSVYNHTSSYDAITGSWEGNLFNGDIVYPMADYGKRIQFSSQDFVGIDDNEDALTVADYKPAMRLKAIWDAIFEKVGFTYTGSFFNESWLDDVYVLLNNKGRYPIYNYANLETLGTGKVSAITGSADNYALTNNTITNFPLNAVNYNNNNSFTVGNPIKYTTPISSSRYSANIQLSYRVTNNGANTQSQYPAWYLYYYDDNGNQLNAQTLATINDYTERVAVGRTTTVTENFTVNQFVNIPQINSGSVNFKVLYQAYTTAGGGGIAATPNFNVVLNPTSGKDYCSLEITQARQGADNRLLEIPINMPFGTNGIKLVEFIRSVQKKFNLLIYESKSVPNQMIVETFNDWYLQGTVQDFNQYINLDEKLEFIPANTLAVNKVSFSDKDDVDYIEKTFKQVNNRIYGQSFWLDTGSYFSEGEFKVETSFGSGPIFQLPLTVASGSAVTSNTCTTYKIQNNDDQVYSVDYTDCDTGLQYIIGITGFETTYVCSRNIPIPVDEFSNLTITSEGDCSPAPPTGSVSSSFLPVAIPLYIGDQDYSPTQVFPRVMFNNGMISSSQYYIEGQFSKANPTVVANAESTYPYFDNYNVVTGAYPTTGSRSLLFNNETATLGSAPQNSLIDDYWRTYLELLYNPRTRLVNATAVIPLAKYFDMELNDLVQFRGNYYHLRAINDYDLTTGECLIQLLGPVITDAVAAQLFGTEKKKTPVNLGDFNCDFSEDFNNGDIICDTCCTPSITNVGITGSSFAIYFTDTGSGCVSCASNLFQSSSDGGSSWGGNFTSSCISPATTIIPTTSSIQYRMQQTCAYGITSSFSAPFTFNETLAEYLIVAGGGGGGSASGGAGGAGGFISGSLSLLPGAYSITVGAGGAASIYPSAPIAGGDSTFFGLTAFGGGQGIVGGGGPPAATSGNGGSGAGGGSVQGLAGTGSLNQGFAGGNASGGPYFCDGGGGGARQTGSAGTSTTDLPTNLAYAGNGGQGALWVDGLYYAGGGGGSFTTAGLGKPGAAAGIGGIGGGGRGALSVAVPGLAGQDGTGGGAGSGGNNGVPIIVDGKKGGDGIVKIRYAGTGSKASGGNTFFSGSYTYHSFGNTTGSQTFTVF